MPTTKPQIKNNVWPPRAPEGYVPPNETTSSTDNSPTSATKSEVLNNIFYHPFH